MGPRDRDTHQIRRWSLLLPGLTTSVGLAAAYLPYGGLAALLGPLLTLAAAAGIRRQLRARLDRERRARQRLAAQCRRERQRLAGAEHGARVLRLRLLPYLQTLEGGILPGLGGGGQSGRLLRAGLQAWSDGLREELLGAPEPAAPAGSDETAAEPVRPALLLITPALVPPALAEHLAAAGIDLDQASLFDEAWTRLSQRDYLAVIVALTDVHLAAWRRLVDFELDQAGACALISAENTLPTHDCDGHLGHLNAPELIALARRQMSARQAVREALAQA